MRTDVPFVHTPGVPGFLLSVLHVLLIAPYTPLYPRTCTTFASDLIHPSSDLPYTRARAPQRLRLHVRASCVSSCVSRVYPWLAPVGSCVSFAAFTSSSVTTSVSFPLPLPLILLARSSSVSYTSSCSVHTSKEGGGSY
ncbi:hypothetical protein BD310DRAFT_169209 [Dichomitus squalens]|uniref:Uncharacterized protein n=1 Tax=Dichomitus squalens TaxID=114155 RepID=A0A4Q9PE91_9APHY|nr:hypothetical protein BD310DRAFT_169209 [Dichomitus squalens]